MTEVVLDASAITAVLRREPGHENVIPYLRGGLVSCVNLAEVLCTARRHGSAPEMDQRAISTMNLTQVAFTTEQANIVSSIFMETQGGTIGIADRACLSLGLLRSKPVLTGDREWLEYGLGVEVILFREGSLK